MAKGNRCPGEAFLRAVDSADCIESLTKDKLAKLRSMGNSAWCRSEDTTFKPCNKLECALAAAGLARISNIQRSNAEMTYMLNYGKAQD